MIVVGIVLIPIIALIMKLLWSYDTGKLKRILLHISMAAISCIYIICCFALHIEPFNYEINEVEDYFIGISCIFLFSPFLWMVVFYYCSAGFKKMRIHKSAKIKSKKYKYYRADLDKISPGILMFTYKMNVDLRKSISATLLKLKLDGYVTEYNNQLMRTAKKDDGLAGSEKEILKSIQNNLFNEKKYKQLIEKETLDYKFIKKNNGGALWKMVKILATIALPIVLVYSSIVFDSYVFHTYQIYDFDGVRYIRIDDEKEVEQLYEKEVKNTDDYYHSYYEEEKRWSYNYSLIRADRLQYGFVRKVMLLRFLDPIFLFLSIVMIFVSLFMLILQIKYFNKDYKRTLKGNDLINKAYALKNYLRDYSLLKEKSEDSLILWEYYLIYAVALDVNMNIQDELIEKYVKTVEKY